MGNMTPTTNEMRNFAVDVVRTLRAGGYESLWAGGCVRDHVLGHEPKDFDVATSATPAQVRALFRRTVAVGESFGVVRVLGRSGIAVEVATFRTDATYSDGRHPDAVTFSTAQEDAQRRDFTINGMFFDPLADKVIDFVGGKEDLQQGLIRAIGDPNARIAEDKLRMLRAVRFAARFSFQLERSTLEAIQQRAHDIHVVSAERVLTEFRSIITARTRSNGLALLHSSRLWQELWPEAAQALEQSKIWDQTLQLLGDLEQEISLGLAMAGLTAQLPLDWAEAYSDQWLLRFKSTNEDRDQAAWLITHRDALRNSQSQKLSLLKRLFVHRDFEELLLLHRKRERMETNGTAESDYIRNLKESLSAADINPPPLITGNDLISLNIRPSPAYKSILEQVRDAQLENAIQTKEQGIEMVQKLVQNAK